MSMQPPGPAQAQCSRPPPANAAAVSHATAATVANSNRQVEQGQLQPLPLLVTETLNDIARC